MVNTGLNAWVHTVGLLPQLGQAKAAASSVLRAPEAATGRPQPHWPACWCVFPPILSSVGMQELQGQHGTLWPAFRGASCAYGWTVLVVTPLTVTNALFGSDMQHYGSLGRCNGNLGGFISCPPAEGINPVLHCSQLHGPHYECTTGMRGDGAIQYRHWLFFQQRSFCICLLLLLLLMRL